MPRDKKNIIQRPDGWRPSVARPRDFRGTDAEWTEYQWQKFVRENLERINALRQEQDIVPHSSVFGSALNLIKGSTGGKYSQDSGGNVGSASKMLLNTLTGRGKAVPLYNPATGKYDRKQVVASTGGNRTAGLVDFALTPLKMLAGTVSEMLPAVKQTLTNIFDDTKAFGDTFTDVPLPDLRLSNILEKGEEIIDTPLLELGDALDDMSAQIQKEKRSVIGEGKFINNLTDVLAGKAVDKAVDTLRDSFGSKPSAQAQKEWADEFDTKGAEKRFKTNVQREEMKQAGTYEGSNLERRDYIERTGKNVSAKDWTEERDARIEQEEIDSSREFALETHRMLSEKESYEKEQAQIQSDQEKKQADIDSLNKKAKADRRSGLIGSILGKYTPHFLENDVSDSVIDEAESTGNTELLKKYAWENQRAKEALDRLEYARRAKEKAEFKEYRRDKQTDMLDGGQLASKYMAGELKYLSLSEIQRVSDDAQNPDSKTSYMSELALKSEAGRVYDRPFELFAGEYEYGTPIDADMMNILWHKAKEGDQRAKEILSTDQRFKNTEAQFASRGRIGNTDYYDKVEESSALGRYNTELEKQLGITNIYNQKDKPLEQLVERYQLEHDGKMPSLDDAFGSEGRDIAQRMKDENFDVFTNEHYQKRANQQMYADKHGNAWDKDIWRAYRNRVKTEGFNEDYLSFRYRRGEQQEKVKKIAQDACVTAVATALTVATGGAALPAVISAGLKVGAQAGAMALAESGLLSQANADSLAGLVNMATSFIPSGSAKGAVDWAQSVLDGASKASPAVAKFILDHPDIAKQTADGIIKATVSVINAETRQVSQNIAQGRDITEGMGKAAGMAVVSSGMGSVAGAVAKGVQESVKSSQVWKNVGAGILAEGARSGIEAGGDYLAQGVGNLFDEKSFTDGLEAPTLAGLGKGAVGAVYRGYKSGRANQQANEKRIAQALSAQAQEYNDRQLPDLDIGSIGEHGAEAGLGDIMQGAREAQEESLAKYNADNEGLANAQLADQFNQVNAFEQKDKHDDFIGEQYQKAQTSQGDNLSSDAVKSAKDKIDNLRNKKKELTKGLSSPYASERIETRKKIADIDKETELAITEYEHALQDRAHNSLFTNIVADTVAGAGKAVAGEAKNLQNVLNAFGESAQDPQNKEKSDKLKEAEDKSGVIQFGKSAYRGRQKIYGTGKELVKVTVQSMADRDHSQKYAARAKEALGSVGNYVLSAVDQIPVLGNKILKWTGTKEGYERWAENHPDEVSAIMLNEMIYAPAFKTAGGIAKVTLKAVGKVKNGVVKLSKTSAMLKQGKTAQEVTKATEGITQRHKDFLLGKEGMLTWKDLKSDTMTVNGKEVEISRVLRDGTMKNPPPRDILLKSTASQNQMRWQKQLEQSALEDPVVAEALYRRVMRERVSKYDYLEAEIQFHKAELNEKGISALEREEHEGMLASLEKELKSVKKDPNLLHTNEYAERKSLVKFQNENPNALERFNELADKSSKKVLSEAEYKEFQHLQTKLIEANLLFERIEQSSSMRYSLAEASRASGFEATRTQRDAFANVVDKTKRAIKTKKTKSAFGGTNPKPLKDLYDDVKDIELSDLSSDEDEKESKEKGDKRPEPEKKKKEAKPLDIEVPQREEAGAEVAGGDELPPNKRPEKPVFDTSTPLTEPDKEKKKKEKSAKKLEPPIGGMKFEGITRGEGETEDAYGKPEGKTGTHQEKTDTTGLEEQRVRARNKARIRKELREAKQEFLQKAGVKPDSITAKQIDEMFEYTPAELEQLLNLAVNSVPMPKGLNLAQYEWDRQFREFVAERQIQRDKLAEGTPQQLAEFNLWVNRWYKAHNIAQGDRDLPAVQNDIVRQEIFAQDKRRDEEKKQDIKALGDMIDSRDMATVQLAGEYKSKRKELADKYGVSEGHFDKSIDLHNKWAQLRARGDAENALRKSRNEKAKKYLEDEKKRESEADFDRESERIAGDVEEQLRQQGSAQTVQGTAPDLRTLRQRPPARRSRRQGNRPLPAPDFGDITPVNTRDEQGIDDYDEDVANTPPELRESAIRQSTIDRNRGFDLPNPFQEFRVAEVPGTFTELKTTNLPPVQDMPLGYTAPVSYTLEEWKAIKQQEFEQERIDAIMRRNPDKVIDVEAVDDDGKTYKHRISLRNLNTGIRPTQEFQNVKLIHKADGGLSVRYTSDEISKSIAGKQRKQLEEANASENRANSLAQDRADGLYDQPSLSSAQASPYDTKQVPLQNLDVNFRIGQTSPVLTPLNLNQEQDLSKYRASAPTPYMPQMEDFEGVPVPMSQLEETSANIGSLEPLNGTVEPPQIMTQGQMSTSPQISNTAVPLQYPQFGMQTSVMPEFEDTDDGQVYEPSLDQTSQNIGDMTPSMPIAETNVPQTLDIKLPEEQVDIADVSDVPFDRLAGRPEFAQRDEGEEPMAPIPLNWTGNAEDFDWIARDHVKRRVELAREIYAMEVEKDVNGDPLFSQGDIDQKRWEYGQFRDNFLKDWQFHPESIWGNWQRGIALRHHDYLDAKDQAREQEILNELTPADRLLLGQGDTQGAGLQEGQAGRHTDGTSAPQTTTEKMQEWYDIEDPEDAIYFASQFDLPASRSQSEDEDIPALTEDAKKELEMEDPFKVHYQKEPEWDKSTWLPPRLEKIKKSEERKRIETARDWENMQSGDSLDYRIPPDRWKGTAEEWDENVRQHLADTMYMDLDERLADDKLFAQTFDVPYVHTQDNPNLPDAPMPLGYNGSQRQWNQIMRDFVAHRTFMQTAIHDADNDPLASRWDVKELEEELRLYVQEFQTEYGWNRDIEEWARDEAIRNIGVERQLPPLEEERDERLPQQSLMLEEPLQSTLEDIPPDTLEPSAEQEIQDVDMFLPEDNRPNTADIPQDLQEFMPKPQTEGGDIADLLQEIPLDYTYNSYFDEYVPPNPEQTLPETGIYNPDPEQPQETPSPEETADEGNFYDQINSGLIQFNPITNTFQRSSPLQKQSPSSSSSSSSSSRKFSDLDADLDDFFAYHPEEEDNSRITQPLREGQTAPNLTFQRAVDIDVPPEKRTVPEPIPEQFNWVSPQDLPPLQEEPVPQRRPLELTREEFFDIYPEQREPEERPFEDVSQAEAGAHFKFNWAMSEREFNFAMEQIPTDLRLQFINDYNDWISKPDIRKKWGLKPEDFIFLPPEGRRASNEITKSINSMAESGKEAWEHPFLTPQIERPENKYGFQNAPPDKTGSGGSGGGGSYKADIQLTPVYLNQDPLQDQYLPREDYTDAESIPFHGSPREGIIDGRYPAGEWLHATDDEGNREVPMDEQLESQFRKEFPLTYQKHESLPQEAQKYWEQMHSDDKNISYSTATPASFEGEYSVPQRTPPKVQAQFDTLFPDSAQKRLQNMYTSDDDSDDGDEPSQYTERFYQQYEPISAQGEIEETGNRPWDGIEEEGYEHSIMGADQDWDNPQSPLRNFRLHPILPSGSLRTGENSYRSQNAQQRDVETMLDRRRLEHYGITEKRPLMIQGYNRKAQDVDIMRPTTLHELEDIGSRHWQINNPVLESRSIQGLIYDRPQDFPDTDVPALNAQIEKDLLYTQGLTDDNNWTRGRHLSHFSAQKDFQESTNLPLTPFSIDRQGYLNQVSTQEDMPHNDPILTTDGRMYVQTPQNVIVRTGDDTQGYAYNPNMYILNDASIPDIRTNAQNVVSQDLNSFKSRQKEPNYALPQTVPYSQYEDVQRPKEYKTSIDVPIGTPDYTAQTSTNIPAQSLPKPSHNDTDMSGGFNPAPQGSNITPSASTQGSNSAFTSNIEGAYDMPDTLPSGFQKFVSPSESANRSRRNSFSDEAVVNGAQSGGGGGGYPSNIPTSAGWRPNPQTGAQGQSSSGGIMNTLASGLSSAVPVLGSLGQIGGAVSGLISTGKGIWDTITGADEKRRKQEAKEAEDLYQKRRNESIQDRNAMQYAETLDQKRRAEAQQYGLSTERGTVSWVTMPDGSRHQISNLSEQGKKQLETAGGMIDKLGDANQYATDASDAIMSEYDRRNKENDAEAMRKVQDSLARRGISMDSPAYRAAMKREQDRQDEARQNAFDRAVNQGYAVGSDQYKNALAGFNTLNDVKSPMEQYKEMAGASAYSQSAVIPSWQYGAGRQDSANQYDMQGRQLQQNMYNYDAGQDQNQRNLERTLAQQSGQQYMQNQYDLSNKETQRGYDQYNKVLDNYENDRRAIRDNYYNQNAFTQAQMLQNQAHVNAGLQLQQQHQYDEARINDERDYQSKLPPEERRYYQPANSSFNRYAGMANTALGGVQDFAGTLYNLNRMFGAGRNTGNN